jgi:hypothetical protein
VKEEGERDCTDHSYMRVGGSRLHARALLDVGICSQASEGMWGMPGHTEARKAAVSCEKLGGVAHTQ